MKTVGRTTRSFNQSVISVARSCPTLCDPMDCSTLGFSVHHQFPELAQTHVHSVGDAIESVMPPPSVVPFSSCPQFFPAIRVFSNELALPIRWPKYQSSSFSINLPMNIQDWFPLGLTAWISLQAKGLLRIFSSTIIQKHQFFTAQLSLWSTSHIHT